MIYLFVFFLDIFFFLILDFREKYFLFIRYKINKKYYYKLYVVYFVFYVYVLRFVWYRKVIWVIEYLVVNVINYLNFQLMFVIEVFYFLI